MHRFFVDPENVKEGYAIISGLDAKHAKTVMRLGEGDELLLIDGSGKEYTGIIEEVENDLRVRITVERECNREPKVKLTLIQSLLKGDKMDYIAQKCTELGVSRIIPCVTKRCVVKEDRKDSNKINRLRRIVLESSKQSGRAIVPFVEDIYTLDEVLDLIKKSNSKKLFIFPWEVENEVGIKTVLSGKNAEGVEEIFYAIGPEGGFAKDEVDKAVNIGANVVTLGPRILRSDTAAISVATMILFELGEMG